jgi:hypothetical protein
MLIGSGPLQAENKNKLPKRESIVARLFIKHPFLEF